MLLGLLATFSPGSLFCLLLACLIILALQLFTCEEDRRFLITLFISGILIRILLLLAVIFAYSFVNKWVVHPGDVKVIDFIGDSSFYTARGWWLTQYFTDKPMSQVLINAAFNEYGFSAYLYLISLFYFLFGFSPISFTFTNCILGVLTGIIYYFIAKDLAGRREARLVSILVVFFPSLIIWSITNLKDPFFIFLIALTLWAFIKLVTTKQVKFLIILFFAMAFQYYVRKFFTAPIILAVTFSYLMIKRKWRLIILGLLILIAALAVFDVDLLAKFKTYFITYNRGAVRSGGSTYRIFDDWIYSLNFTDYASVSNFTIAVGFLKGAIHFFLEPFLWKITKVSILVSVPQMIIWYFLLFFSIPGIVLQLRRNWRKSLVLVAYLFITGGLLVISGGNIGTVFRFRDLVTPIVILFAVIGICHIMRSEREIKG